MWLRLRLLNEDLAERFGVSSTLSSCIFTALVVRTPKESIREYLTEIFLKSGCGKCRVIMDCAELFIERPRFLSSQAATWSDYKHHNTFQFLVGIRPTGFVLFLSSSYGGRASDKFITRDNEFYDL